jgi:hypothetical protein
LLILKLHVIFSNEMSSPCHFLPKISARVIFGRRRSAAQLRFAGVFCMIVAIGGGGPGLPAAVAVGRGWYGCGGGGG